MLRAAVLRLVQKENCQILDGFLRCHIGYGVASLVDKLEVPALYIKASGDDLSQRQAHKWILQTGSTMQVLRD